MLSNPLSNPLTPEVIRQHGAEELVELRRRVVLWKEDFFRLAPPEGGSDYLFLCNDFIQEIEEYLYPYLSRLRVTEHIDQTELDGFMEFCYQQVYELQDFLNRNEVIPGNGNSSH
jgi:hypothetical protein